MNITSIGHGTLTDCDARYDLIIVASGYETRARFVAEQLPVRLLHSGTEKIVFSFNEHRNVLARRTNDEQFAIRGYREVLCNGGSGDDIGRTLAEAFDRLPTRRSAHVLVDISSMTRAWYGAIVRSLMAKWHDSSIVVDFTYTAAQFTLPPSHYPPNRIVAPVVGFTGNALPDKPTALVIGLGYDEDRALGLRHYLDPEHAVLFYAKPASDNRYIREIFRVNRSILNDTGKEEIFTYPFWDFGMTFRVLESVCNGLSQRWRVVLCSLGPKTFGLCCFLVASLHRDISIWRVSADWHATPFDHKPVGEPTLLRTGWHTIRREV